MATMSRYTYELARDHSVDPDSPTDVQWHIVRTDDETDPQHLRGLCGGLVEPPTERWNAEVARSLGELVCHQCVTRHIAEAGAEAA